MFKKTKSAKKTNDVKVYTFSSLFSQHFAEFFKPVGHCKFYLVVRQKDL
jgi:hypothetical protein